MAFDIYGAGEGSVSLLGNDRPAKGEICKWKRNQLMKSAQLWPVQVVEYTLCFQIVIYRDWVYIIV